MTKHPGLTHYAHAHNNVPRAENSRESEEELEFIRSSVQQSQELSQAKDDPVDIAEEPVDIKPDPDTLPNNPVTTSQNNSTQNIIVFSNQPNVLNSDNSQPAPSAVDNNPESQEDGGYQVSL